MHQSIATIDSPEFINLQPLELNPLMSSCEIKVLYVGENRNHSFITKEVATEMSKTLRGAPIVGYFKPEKDDFADHGERVILDDEGIKFECMTKPYGFVAPDAKVWFQKFEDYDDFGNTVIREYLMTTGYLWTGQFEECASVVHGGKPQSMELDENTLNGKWSTNTKTGMDFFIINDAIFSKLCILGDDVEPCFEGASITSTNVSTSFSLDDTFKNTLFNMMQDLRNFALQEGGQQMDSLENTMVDAPETEPVVEDNQTQDNVNEVEASENQNFTEENPLAEELETSFKKNEEDEDKEKEKSENDSNKPESESEKDSNDGKSDEDEKKKKTTSAKNTLDEQKYAELESKFTALETKYSNLKTEYSDLEARCNDLLTFKQNIEDAKKDELIKSFYMLSDEDKKEVIENKGKYSYDDIEAKLSVICVRKKVNFDLEDTSKNDNTVEETPTVTFNLDNAESSVPAWISALKNARNNKNN